jgi:hypothetical protein
MQRGYSEGIWQTRTPFLLNLYLRSHGGPHAMRGGVREWKRGLYECLLRGASSFLWSPSAYGLDGDERADQS